ncbi:MAG: DUF2334 domain-containing protein [Firmicutes bacterium]|nr:DUF2334 domain-containing protein [Bacillota bacterium]
MKKIIFFLVVINLMTSIGFVTYLIISEERYEKLESAYRKAEEEQKGLMYAKTNLNIIEAENVEIRFLNDKLNLKNKIYFANGRIFVPLLEYMERIGGKVYKVDDVYRPELGEESFDAAYIGNDDKIRQNVIYIDDVVYISFFEVTDRLGLSAVFDSSHGKIDVFYKQKKLPDESVIKKKVDSKAAYLRLEDIMADGVDPEGSYNDEGLEKLRIIGDYLFDREQVFYIAWIPVYCNPKKDILNDPMETSSLYNAEFIYTLDYLVSRGGKIGLHGYTHQYGEEKSADGFEFGENSPYTDEQKEERMIAALKIANYFKFNVEFFEFPHYGATEQDFKTAEKYFDVIYQQSPYTMGNNKIDKISRGGRLIKYVPTPADYVHNRYGVSDMIERIEMSNKNEDEISLFVHPILDFEYISVGTVGTGIREYHYSPFGVLPTIIDEVMSLDHSFNEIG